jgi:hypothetical protein
MRLAAFLLFAATLPPGELGCKAALSPDKFVLAPGGAARIIAARS